MKTIQIELTEDEAKHTTFALGKVSNEYHKAIDACSNQGEKELYINGKYDIDNVQYRINKALSNRPSKSEKL